MQSHRRTPRASAALAGDALRPSAHSRALVCQLHAGGGSERRAAQAGMRVADTTS
jgi:hypothetical protein